MFSSFYPPGLQKTEDRNLSNDIIVTVMSLLSLVQ